MGSRVPRQVWPVMEHLSDSALDGLEETHLRLCSKSSATEKRSTMAKYMIKASYSPEGSKGVVAKGGTARAEAIEEVGLRSWRHSGWCVLLVRF